MASLIAKSLLIILMFFVIINITISASVDIGLDKTSYGPQRSFAGNLTINVNQIPSSAKLVFELDGQSIEKELNETCFDKIPSSYSIVSSNVASPIIDFSSADSNTSYAFDIIVSSPSSLSINPVSMTIEGAQKTNYPTAPTLDINSDNKIDWEYIGPLIKENGQTKFVKIQPNYLLNYIPFTGGYTISIKGQKSEEYCEKVQLPLSQAYKIETYVKTVNTNGNLSARIRKNNGAELTNQSNTQLKANCSISANTLSSNFEWKSCEIDNSDFRFIDAQNQDYYICVYSDGATSSATYYNIAFQQASATNKGCDYVSGSCRTPVGDVDYFIVSYYGDYDKNFNTQVLLSNQLKSAMTSCSNTLKDSNNFIHCLFPLKFTSKSDGIIKITQAYIKNGAVESNTPISKISYVPELMDCADNKNYYLDLENQEIDFSDLKTPGATGDYKLTIKLKDGEKIYSQKTVDFSVVSAPTVSISATRQTGINTPINFNTTVLGEEPFTYSWDFGDNNKSTESNPVHTYKTLGNYNVTLVVTDKNGISETSNINIDIVSSKQSLELLLNSTRDSLTEIQNKFSSATGSTLDVINALKLNDLMTNLTFNLAMYETSFKTTNASTTKPDSAKEQEFSVILQNLLTLRNSIPSKLDILSVSYDPKLNSYNDIPDELVPYGQTPDTFKKGVFSLQDRLSVKSDSYSIEIDYLNGLKEEFRLVKKVLTISGSMENLSVIEYIPKIVSQSIKDKDILTPGFTIITADPVIKWPALGSMNIIYKLDSGALDSLIDTKTFLYTGEEIATNGFENEPNCGDGTCDVLEEGYCDIDCVPKYPWLFLTFLLLLIIGGVYYINFYKGKWNFKELVNWVSVKLGKKRLFTSEQDLLNLEKYVKYAISKGTKEEQLRQILSKKGWKKEQIDYVFKKIK